MSHLTFSQAGALLAVAYLGALLLLCALPSIHRSLKKRRMRHIDRLLGESLFFRGMHHPYYRARK